MKTKLLISTVFLLVWVCVSAQTDVTKFLGIPVDGTKSEMISKLEKKGFVWNKNLGRLTGEFNGTKVIVDVVTNKNKVYRIIVDDTYPMDEIGIKNRFNKLCSQFENNKKYTSMQDDGFYVIPDSENIADSMSTNKKRYEAAYYQLPEKIDTIAIKKQVETMYALLYPDLYPNNLENAPDSVLNNMSTLAVTIVLGEVLKRSVWFMIYKMYDGYRIAMYYDNVYNQANGEDL